jgi:hypothetical protein
MNRFIEKLQQYAVMPSNLPALFGLMSPKARKILDAVLLSVFFVVCWINGVPGFPFVFAMCYAFWQYTDGYIAGVENHDREMKIEGHAVTISNKTLERISAIMPGQVLEMRTKDGIEYTICPSIDFEHILSLAGLRTNAAEDPRDAQG